MSWSGSIWWAREELSLRPLPRQQIQGTAARTAPFCRSCSTVSTEVRAGRRTQRSFVLPVGRAVIERRSTGLGHGERILDRVFKGGRGSANLPEVDYPTTAGPVEGERACSLQEILRNRRVWSVRSG
jgi:hypothetical protein